MNEPDFSDEAFQHWMKTKHKAGLRVAVPLLVVGVLFVEMIVFALSINPWLTFLLGFPVGVVASHVGSKYGEKVAGPRPWMRQ